MAAKQSKKQLRMKQIVAAQWAPNSGGMTYSTLALGEDGAVYRYDAQCSGWVKWNMQLAHCEVPHKR